MKYRLIQFVGFVLASAACFGSDRMTYPSGCEKNIFDLIYSKNTSKISKIPKGNPCLSRRDGDGLTPLHVAAGLGETSVVRVLLEKGADPFSLDSKMAVSILHKAVYSGNPETVATLLAAGAPIDLQSPSNGDTPLHDALYFKSGKDIRVIKLLLEKGANENIRNRAGFTPLESSRVLHDKEAEEFITAYIAKKYSPSGTELMAAVRENSIEKVKEIFAKSPNMNLEEPDPDGFTPLLWSARQGYVEIVKLLLNKGANPNHLDTWMHATAGHKAGYWGQAAVMPLLIEHGLDINARGGYNGYTALHDAIQGNHFETAEVLLKYGARTDVRGHDGKTPFDVAQKNDNQRILALLSKYQKKGKTIE